MTITACDSPWPCVLGMAEEYVIGQVMNLDPFNGNIVVVCIYYFCNFDSTRSGPGPYKQVAIHADVNRRDPCCFAYLSKAMAINTISFVLSGMNKMRKFYRLIR